MVFSTSPGGDCHLVGDKGIPVVSTAKSSALYVNPGPSRRRRASSPIRGLTRMELVWICMRVSALSYHYHYGAIWSYLGYWPDQPQAKKLITRLSRDICFLMIISIVLVFGYLDNLLDQVLNQATFGWL